MKKIIFMLLFVATTNAQYLELGLTRGELLDMIANEVDKDLEIVKKTDGMITTRYYSKDNNEVITNYWFDDGMFYDTVWNITLQCEYAPVETWDDYAENLTTMNKDYVFVNRDVEQEFYYTTKQLTNFEHEIYFNNVEDNETISFLWSRRNGLEIQLIGGQH